MANALKNKPHFYFIDILPTISKGGKQQNNLNSNGLQCNPTSSPYFFNVDFQ